MARPPQQQQAQPTAATRVRKKVKKNVAEGINATLSPEMGVLMITHYQRMLNYVQPHFVHVLLDGRVVMSGGDELSHQLEANGYDWVREQVGLPAGVGDSAGSAEPVASH